MDSTARIPTALDIRMEVFSISMLEFRRRGIY
jgi:hypothetical protein